MAEFSWAYIDGGSPVSAGGVSGSMQYRKASNSAELTGSNNLIFKDSINVLELTGSLKVKGTIQSTDVIASYGNPTVVSYDTVIPANYRAIWYGDDDVSISVSSGVTLEIGTGAVLKIQEF